MKFQKWEKPKTEHKLCELCGSLILSGHSWMHVFDMQRGEIFEYLCVDCGESILKNQGHNYNNNCPDCNQEYEKLMCCESCGCCWVTGRYKTSD